jgi:hypothetical protein
VGDYGHFKPSGKENLILKIKDGAKTDRDVLMVDISTVYLSADAEFSDLVGA